jgi:hypothetical protein
MRGQTGPDGAACANHGRSSRHDSPAALDGLDGQRTERLQSRRVANRGSHGWCYHDVMPSPEHMQRAADDNNNGPAAS